MGKQYTKTDIRRLASAWEEEYRALMTAATVDYTESESDKIKRVKHLETSDEDWFSYYFSEYASAPPAKFHKTATRRLMTHDRWFEVRAWSRELAKSTRSMMEIIKLSLTGKIKNVLLISNSQENAIRLLDPFRIAFESNGRLINDYGQQQNPGSWEAAEFTILAGCAFRAIGAGQSPRGTRSKSRRPDFILVDDIDTDEETRNPDRIQKKWEWIEQALIPTMSISNSYRILFNGNVIARDCCVTRAMKKANHTDIINIRDKNGMSSWPEKNSEEDIDCFLSMISTIAVQKEYYNNPISEGETFKEMTWGVVPPLNRFPFLVDYSDPAPSNNTKAKANSYKSNFLIGILGGKVYVITGFLDKVTNAEFVDWFYHIDNYVGGKTQVCNYIENNTLQDPFYEQVFIPLFAAARDKSGKIINITPDARKKPDKFARIEGNLEPLNRAGNLILNIAEQGNPHMQRLEEQFKMINPRLTAPADGVDCVEGGFFIANVKNTQLAPGLISVGTHRKHSKRF
ncbi:MAG: hypothetical protein LBQ73_02215 [Tannerellaceae bacterium]|jgi:hypothetical protein|nr:hypothetical protein [Tannerellaceae bacterium]